MKINFLHKTDASESPGVLKKIHSQIAAMRQHGATVKFTRLTGSLVQKTMTAVKTALTPNDVIFIRNISFFLPFTLTANRLFKHNALIVFEVPTPIANSFDEIRGLKQSLTKIRLKLFLLPGIYAYAVNCADLVLEYAPDSFPSIRKHSEKVLYIENGYEMPTDRSYVSITPSIDLENNYVLCVAKAARWHGIDRAIRGLKDYYEKANNPDSAGRRTVSIKKNIHLNIVGDGNEIPNLKKLTTHLKLDDYVHFLGSRDQRQIHQLAENSLFGLGSLANHRKGMFHETSLKAREYCAFGLPFVLTASDNDFPDSLPFVTYAPLDESPLDFNSLLEYFCRLDRNITRQEMAAYAESRLSWTMKLAPVMERINELLISRNEQIN